MEQFNPYHKWLGVSRTETTPKPYQLLGVESNEDDPEVIRAAAIRQSTYVRHFQSGQHAQIAARVLEEIEQAKLSLLDSPTRNVRHQSVNQAETPPRHAHGETQSFPATNRLILVGFSVLLILLMIFVAWRITHNQVDSIPTAHENESSQLAKNDTNAITAASSMQTVNDEPVSKSDAESATFDDLEAVIDSVAIAERPSKKTDNRISTDPSEQTQSSSSKLAEARTSSKSSEGVSGKIIGKRSVDNGSPMEMATWSPDGKKIATAGVDGTIRIWNAATLGLEHELSHAPRGGLEECLFTTEDGSRLVAPTKDGMIQLWDVPSERVLKTNQSSGQIISLARSMWGDTFFVRIPQNKVEIYRATDLERASSFQIPFAVDWWTVLASIPTRNLHAVISESGDVVVFNLALSRPPSWSQSRMEISKRITPPDRPSPTCLGVSRDGSRLAVGSRTGSVFVYDTANWEQVCHCGLQTYPALSVAFSPDGKHVVTGGVDWELRVWDATSGRLLKQHWPGKRQISSVVFSPDGSEVLFTQDQRGQALFVWPTSTLLD